jgi:hypothetical protein
MGNTFKAYTKCLFVDKKIPRKMYVLFERNKNASNRKFRTHEISIPSNTFGKL